MSALLVSTLCLSICLPFSFSLFLCVCMSVSVSVSVSFSVYLSVGLSLQLVVQAFSLSWFTIPRTPSSYRREKSVLFDTRPQSRPQSPCSCMPERAGESIWTVFERLERLEELEIRYSRPERETISHNRLLEALTLKETRIVLCETRSLDSFAAAITRSITQSCPAGYVTQRVELKNDMISGTWTNSSGRTSLNWRR